MKNQYVADINDYRKYGLLRILSDGGRIRIGCCWMLTADDGHTDGNFTAYVDSPSQWQHYDPPLFDSLSACIRDRERNVSRIEQEGLIPGATFCSSGLEDAPRCRHAYFDAARRQMVDRELVFFDPDNGLEVKSRPYGSRGCSKFLFWHEATSFFKGGKSLLIYQHFIREERKRFIARLSAEFGTRLGATEVWAFRTPHVVFFLVPRDNHRDLFRSRAEQVQEHWDARQIQVTRYEGAK